MTGTTQVAAVLNPAADHAWAAQAELQRVCRLLEWPDPDIYYTTVTEPGARQARAALREGAQLVVVGGGDGTVRQVAGVLAGTGVPLGILPLGTANLFARNLGLARSDVAEMVQAALLGQARHLDIGLVRYVQLGPAGPVESPPHHFLVLVGAGHDAATVADTRQALKRWVSWLAYFEPGARRLTKALLPLRVEVDGGRREDVSAWSLLVSNCGLIPAGIKVAADAEVDDGLLDLVHVAPPTVAHWAPIALKGLLGFRREVPGLSYRQARTVKVFSEDPVVIQIDGDPHPDILELDCTVLPGQLTVRTARSTQASTISALMRGWTGRGAERRVLRVLRHTPPEELDAVLGEVGLEALVRKLDDHRLGPDHRSALLDLLVRERREVLTVPRLAQLATALHRGPTPRSHELAIRDLVLSLRGEELEEFKSLVNSSGSYHDLDHLVFDDIGDDELRTQILAHIAAEAVGRASADLRILCDIDDTVLCMLHDRRYPRGTVYPGVVEFLLALDHGAAREPGRPGDLTFITARPSDPRGLVESYTRNGLAELGLPPHSVMTGHLLNVATKGRIAERKMANFDRSRLLFPECQVVFIGDNGQADVEVSRAMLARDPEHVRAVFIHHVSPVGPDVRASLAAEGIWLFDTYADAAARAHELGLISEQGFEQVRAAVEATRSG
ncbi:diacylglycerol kinase family protein [Ornithinimicrobium cryptoxanthini]|uniref:diacylglycerol kinase family protein n=1 Tax=Ornithinimicrobium cryptoxanthini TaxID=2934161 RepID=UPI002118B5AA|nr:diacylglycerol kinase family protein [Ornithinimicrobium cryptoxanthini]